MPPKKAITIGDPKPKKKLHKKGGSGTDVKADVYALPEWQGNDSDEKKKIFPISFFSRSSEGNKEEKESEGQNGSANNSHEISFSEGSKPFIESSPLSTDEDEILKLEKVKENLNDAVKKDYTKEELEPVINLVNAIESLGLEEFIEYIKSPWRLLWPNFVAGVARGFGALVGATIVVALVIWGLTQVISLPLIGRYLEPYAKNVQTEFNKYIENTNYTPHFQAIELSLSGIHDTLKGEAPSRSQTGILR